MCHCIDECGWCAGETGTAECSAAAETDSRGQVSASREGKRVVKGVKC